MPKRREGAPASAVPANPETTAHGRRARATDAPRAPAQNAPPLQPIDQPSHCPTEFPCGRVRFALPFPFHLPVLRNLAREPLLFFLEGGECGLLLSLLDAVQPVQEMDCGPTIAGAAAMSALLSLAAAVARQVRRSAVRTADQRGQVPP